MSTTDSPTENGFLTLGQIAARIGVTTHRVKYAIDQYRIEPAMRVGILRVWRERDIPRIKTALDRIASKNGGQYG